MNEIPDPSLRWEVFAAALLMMASVALVVWIIWGAVKAVLG